MKKAKPTFASSRIIQEERMNCFVRERERAGRRRSLSEFHSSKLNGPVTVDREHLKRRLESGKRERKRREEKKERKASI